jgi:hypothetical protein
MWEKRLLDKFKLGVTNVGTREVLTIRQLGVYISKHIIGD